MHRMMVWAGVVAMAGCASSPSSSPEAPVNTSLSALTRGGGSSPAVEVPTIPPPTVVEEMAQEHRVDIQAMLDREAPEELAASVEVVPKPEPQPETVITAPLPPPKSLAERIDETTLLLIDLLRERVATGESPFRSALSLAAMEAVRPGSAMKMITPDSTDGGPLTDEQRDVINAFRELVLGLAEGDDRPGILTDLATNLGNSFLRARPMRIQAALAAKVTGYGQYVPLDVRRIQQGKPARAVVYTEVTRFTQRPIREATKLSESAQPGDKWAVELSQELQLIHDADGVKAWQQREQPVVETSRSYRTDFYLVQTITLPSTLSIGRYKLKVIVRDRASGQEDEAIIPIEVVADPTLVSETPSRLYD